MQKINENVYYSPKEYQQTFITSLQRMEYLSSYKKVSLMLNTISCVTPLMRWIFIMNNRGKFRDQNISERAYIILYHFLFYTSDDIFFNRHRISPLMDGMSNIHRLFGFPEQSTSSLKPLNCHLYFTG